MTRPDVLVRLTVVFGALTVGTLVEWVAGASVPGRMPVFALGAAFLLVLGAKQFGRLVSRPVGTRAGEGGDPADAAPDPAALADQLAPSGGAAASVVSTGVDEDA